MDMIIKNARLFDSGGLVDILVRGGVVAAIGTGFGEGFDACGNYIAPGFVDLHVHLRDPGLTYKEDISSGTLAAVAGGFCTVCAMPNTVPVTDSPEIVKYILAAPAHCQVLPVAAITVAQAGRELTDFQALKNAGAVALSDDGLPVADAELMRRALIKSREHDMLIMSHCEPEDELTLRDVSLAREVGARLHIAHVSTEKSVEHIADAKAAGARITAETCPHYFSMTHEDYARIGADARMNPPLRTRADRAAIIAALKSGVIDCISTDHAPHSPEDKADGANGITGLESAFAAGVSYLVNPGHITLEKLIGLMSLAPAGILGTDSAIKAGGAADFAIFDAGAKFTFDKHSSRSKSRNTPFHGLELYGRVTHTIVGGRLAHAATP